MANDSVHIGQIQKLLSLLKQKRVTPERFQKLLDKGLLADLLDSEVNIDGEATIRYGLRCALNLEPLDLLQYTNRFTVDYGLSPHEMLVGYNVIDPGHVRMFFGVDWHCSEKKPVEFEGVLFRGNSTINALTRIQAADKKNPWQAGTTEQLLAFAQQNPNQIGRYNGVFALGSRVHTDKERHTAMVKRSEEDGQGLKVFAMHCEDLDGWTNLVRFLAVRAKK